MRQQLAQMRDLLRKNGLQMASPPASPVLGAEMFKDTVIKQELDSFPSLFQASRTHSLDPRASVVSTAPSESLPSTPTQTETFGDTTASDLAQHPAEMLCGLPCQSQAWCPESLPSQLPAAIQTSRQLHLFPLFLMAHSITCSSLATPLSQLLASLKKGTRLKAETLTPTMFNLILWLISTPRSPLKPQAPTASPSGKTPNSTPSPLTSTPPMTRSSTFRTSLLRRLLTCSPALARPLKDATARALHEKAKYALGRMSESSSMEHVEEKGESIVSGSQTSKVEIWRLMAVVLVIDQFEKQRSRLWK